MNYAQFLTIIWHLCRIRIHQNYSYIFNFVIRGAGSVVVSASDGHAGGLVIIPGRNKLVMFVYKPTNED